MAQHERQYKFLKASTPRTSLIPEEDWEGVRDTLFKLRVQSPLSVKKIVKIMAETHNFYATTDQYNKRFRKWRWPSKHSDKKSDTLKPRQPLPVVHQPLPLTPSHATLPQGDPPASQYSTTATTPVVTVKCAHSSVASRPREVSAITHVSGPGARRSTTSSLYHHLSSSITTSDSSPSLSRDHSMASTRKSPETVPTELNSEECFDRGGMADGKAPLSSPSSPLPIDVGLSHHDYLPDMKARSSIGKGRETQVEDVMDVDSDDDHDQGGDHDNGMDVDDDAYNGQGKDYGDVGDDGDTSHERGWTSSADTYAHHQLALKDPGRDFNTAGEYMDDIDAADDRMMENRMMEDRMMDRVKDLMAYPGDGPELVHRLLDRAAQSAPVAR